jgi:3,4-dihydroxy 2-butanone 4-phosphate synthase/GTP cyclohydrolase II
MEKIVEAGRGVLLTSSGRPRDQALQQVKAIRALQDEGHDTVSANGNGFPPDIRNYGVRCQILRDLGVRRCG